MKTWHGFNFRWPDGSRRNSTCFAVLMAVGLIAVFPAATTAQDGPGLLDQLGNLFGGRPAAVRPVEVRVAPAIRAVRPIPAVDDDLLKARQARINSWCDNWQHWLNENLDLTADQQQKKIEDILTNAKKREELVWRRNQQQQEVALPDTSVIIFGGRRGAARRIMDAGPSRGRPSRELKAVLTADQLAQFEAITKKREERERELIARRATAVVDTELFLTPEQRDATLESIRKRIRSRSDGLFAFHNQRQYLPYESVAALLPVSDDKMWSDAQKARWKDIRGERNPNNGNVFFQGGETDEAWQARLDNLHQSAQVKLINAAAVRSQYLTTTLNLTPEQARHLEVAGKGSTVRCLRKWKQQSQKQLEQFANQARQRNFGFGIAAPQVSQLDRERLWRKTVESLVDSANESPADIHQRHQIDGAIGFVLLTLDRELLLSDEQHAQMEEVIRNCGLGAVPDGQTHLQEVALVARAVCRSDEAAVKQILNDSQEVVWAEIRKQFRGEGRNVIFTTQHGDMHLSIGK